MMQARETLRRVFARALGTPARIALLALLLLLVAWLLTGNWYKARLIQQARATTAGEVSARASALNAGIHQRIAYLQGLTSYARTEWPESGFDTQFRAYASGFYFNTTGVRTLLLAPQGVTRYIFPTLDREILSGYDVLNDPDPETRAAVQRAIQSGEITLSQPGELRQGGFGMTAWQAIFRGRELWGLAAIALNLETILAEAGITAPHEGLAVALRDNAGTTFLGEDTLWARDPVIETIVLPEGTWEMGALPAMGWSALVRSQMILFRLISLMVILLITWIVYLDRSRQQMLEQAVAQRTQQIVAAQKELEERVEERQRLSRDLHDSVSQVLYSIGLGAKAARSALDGNPAQATDAIDYISRLAEAGQIEMRALIFDLRPESLATDGLVTALERRLAVLRARYQLAVTAEICPEPELPLSAKEALYRVFQEATHNIVKHARANSVHVTLARTSAGYALEITDDGVGFDPSQDYPGHLGLQSMTERAQQQNGSLKIKSQPGQGTTIRLTLPETAGAVSS